MTAEKVFEALMQADRRDVAPVAERLRKTVEHAVVKQPCRELVMFRAEDGVERLDFNVGEVLTTSAEVRVGDSVGYSCVMGLDEGMALDCALLMGVYEADLPEKSEVEALAVCSSGKQEAGLREEMEIASSTRVAFELMGGQDPTVSHNRPPGGKR